MQTQIKKTTEQTKLSVLTNKCSKYKQAGGLLDAKQINAVLKMFSTDAFIYSATTGHLIEFPYLGTGGFLKVIRGKIYEDRVEDKYYQLKWTWKKPKNVFNVSGHLFKYKMTRRMGSIVKDIIYESGLNKFYYNQK